MSLYEILTVLPPAIKADIESGQEKYTQHVSFFPLFLLSKVFFPHCWFYPALSLAIWSPRICHIYYNVDAFGSISNDDDDGNKNIPPLKKRREQQHCMWMTLIGIHLGPLHTYPDTLKTNIFILRFQKNSSTRSIFISFLPRPHGNAKKTEISQHPSRSMRYGSCIWFMTSSYSKTTVFDPSACKRGAGVFNNLHSGERFLKRCVFGDGFQSKTEDDKCGRSLIFRPLHVPFQEDVKHTATHFSFSFWTSDRVTNNSTPGEFSYIFIQVRKSLLDERWRAQKVDKREWASTYHKVWWKIFLYVTVTVACKRKCCAARFCCSEDFFSLCSWHLVKIVSIIYTDYTTLV